MRKKVAGIEVESGCTLSFRVLNRVSSFLFPSLLIEKPPPSRERWAATTATTIAPEVKCPIAIGTDNRDAASLQALSLL